MNFSLPPANVGKVSKQKLHPIPFVEVKNVHFLIEEPQQFDLLTVMVAKQEASKGGEKRNSITFSLQLIGKLKRFTFYILEMEIDERIVNLTCTS